MSTTTNSADCTDSTTDCVAGEQWCAGPDGDRLPCFECHKAAACPNGQRFCDAGEPTHEQGTICFLCGAKNGFTDANAL